MNERLNKRGVEIASRSMIAPCTQVIDGVMAALTRADAMPGVLYRQIVVPAFGWDNMDLKVETDEQRAYMRDARLDRKNYHGRSVAKMLSDAETWEHNFKITLPLRALPMFNMLARPRDIRFLHHQSMELHEAVLAELAANLPLAATRADMVAAIAARYGLGDKSADMALTLSRMDERDTRFDYAPDSPVFALFLDVARGADDAQMFWRSLHGGLAGLGYEYASYRSMELQALIKQAVPEGVIRVKLDQINERAREAKANKKGRMVTTRHAAATRQINLLHMNADVRPAMAADIARGGRAATQFGRGVAAPVAGIPAATKPAEPPKYNIAIKPRKPRV